MPAATGALEGVADDPWVAVGLAVAARVVGELVATPVDVGATDATAEGGGVEDRVATLRTTDASRTAAAAAVALPVERLEFGSDIAPTSCCPTAWVGASGMLAEKAPRGSAR